MASSANQIPESVPEYNLLSPPIAAPEILNNNPAYRSPKRKWAESIPLPRTDIPQYSPNLTPSLQNDESPVPEALAEVPRQASPRTVVAHQFGKMQIRNGNLFDFGFSAKAEDGRAEGSKRPKIENKTSILSQVEDIGATIATSSIPITTSDLSNNKETEVVAGNSTSSSPSKIKASKSPKKVSMASNGVEVTPSKTKSQARTTSPPPDSIDDQIDDPLTWHDHEITGHNPSDPDDDGEGINGIGFKPTPAMATERSLKRKAQIQAYKTREMREARAKRNERRGGNRMSSSETERRIEEAERRVRFMDVTG